MAARYGWEWRVTNLDLGLAALQLGADRRSVVGSVCALPFADESFDAVIASQMTHRLTQDETVQHFPRSLAGHSRCGFPDRRASQRRRVMRHLGVAPFTASHAAFSFRRVAIDSARTACG